MATKYVCRVCGKEITGDFCDDGKFVPCGRCKEYKNCKLRLTGVEKEDRKVKNGVCGICD